MALLYNVLDNGLIDGLLGDGGVVSSLLGSVPSLLGSVPDVSAAVATNPSLDVSASDVLGFDAAGGSFTGIGDLSLGLSAPTMIGVSLTGDHGDSGGLV